MLLSRTTTITNRTKPQTAWQTAVKQSVILGKNKGARRKRLTRFKKQYRISFTLEQGIIFTRTASFKPSHIQRSYLQKIMLTRFRFSELAILFVAVALIFVSEYYYIFLKDHDRAIFIGLWPPTMLLLLVYLNLKKQQ